MFSSFCVSFPLVFYKVDIYRNYMQKSEATSRAGGMRMAPGRGRSHLCWWPLIFKKGIVAHENEPQAENGSAENGLSYRLYILGPL
jgi:hypothetical protein